MRGWLLESRTRSGPTQIHEFFPYQEKYRSIIECQNDAGVYYISKARKRIAKEMVNTF